MTVPYIFIPIDTPDGAQTASQVLTRALRRIKVLASEEVMDAPTQADGLVTMNGLMNSFSARGIAYTHTYLDATDVVNMPDSLIDSLVWMVADSLAVEYGYQMSERELVFVMDAKNMLQAAYWMQPPAETEPMLRSYPYRYNITADV